MSPECALTATVESLREAGT